MCLEELVEVLPNFRNPVNNLLELFVMNTSAGFCFEKFSSEISTEEPFDGFHVVCTQNPSEVVM